MKTFILFMSLLISVITISAQSNGRGGNMPNQKINHHHACLDKEKRHEIMSVLDDNRKLLIKEGKINFDDRSTTQFIWPIKNENGNDEYASYGISNYVDHNSNFPNQLSDYQCKARTYDLAGGYNHQGIDIYLWPFSWYKMENNHVSVIAAASGVILNKTDGFYDKNCSFNNNSWNAVYVQHSDGSVAWYGHLKSGSLTSKSVGQSVSAGEFIGFIGSSGSSTGPHLHFEIYDANNNLIDPYSGPCNGLNNSSWWIDQKPHTDPHVNTLYIHSSPPDFKSCPQTEEVNIVDEVMYNVPYQFATYYNDQQIGDLTKYEILRPDGSLFTNWSQNSPDTYYSSYWYWTRIIPDTEPGGQWTFQVEYDGETYTRSFTIQSLDECKPVNDITLTSSSTSSLDIGWNTDGSPDYFLIFWYDDNGTELGSDEVYITEYSISDLASSTSYCVELKAVCDAIQSSSEVACFETQDPIGTFVWSYGIISGDNTDAPDYLPTDVRDSFFIEERVYATIEMTDVYNGCFLETEFYDPNGTLIFTGESQVDNETGYLGWVRSYSYITPSIQGQYVVDFLVTPENGERQLQQSKLFFVDEITLDYQFELDPISAYPNPFSNQVTITNIDNADIIITDINGNRIDVPYSRNKNDRNYNFNGYSSGIYLASIIKNGHVVSKKLSYIRK